VHRIVKVRRFDHVVLLVAAQPVLRAESGRQLHAGCGQRVQRMREIRGHRGRMRQQRDTPAGQGFAQGRVFQQAVESELHGMGFSVFPVCREPSVRRGA
jgi:hypothetical protein